MVRIPACSVLNCQSIHRSASLRSHGSTGQRPRRVLCCQIALDGVALPENAALVLDSRHDAVRVHVQVPLLVIAAEWAASIDTLVLQAALVGEPQHLLHVDRLGATPDLHTHPRASASPVTLLKA